MFRKRQHPYSEKIRAFYSDADNLGKAMPGIGIGVSSNMTVYASDIPRLFVQYAVERALNRVLKRSAADPVLSVVLAYANVTNVLKS